VTAHPTFYVGPSSGHDRGSQPVGLPGHVLLGRLEPREPRSSLGENEVGDEGSGVVVHRRLDVRIGLQGDRDVIVAEVFLDHSRVDAVGEGDRCPGVPKAVRRQVRHLVLADSPLEGLVNTLGVEWVPSGSQNT